MGTGQLLSEITALLWVGALAATPLALIVGGMCRWKSLRPATRHMLWLVVLASFVTPAIGTWIWRPEWFRTDRLVVARSPGAAPVATASGPAPAAESVPTTPAPPASPVREAFPTSAPLAGAASPAVVLAAPARPAPPTASGAASFSPISHLVPWLAYQLPSVAARPRDGAPNHEPAPDPGAPRAGGLDLPVVASTSLRGTSEAPSGGAPRPTAGASAPTAPRGSPMSEVDDWVKHAVGVRDAVAALPPLPATIWLGGAILLIVLSLWRTLAAWCWIRRAEPAGAEVQAMVRELSAALGLSRIPRAVFVGRAVSPMVWCGPSPRVVVPAALWRSLDADSRRAVLMHELAHVKRWDHVLCWLETLVGAVYWWHPLVWWARRRLHDAAEASCDAWVTSLFPSSRTAYASALVVTKSYLSSRAGTGGPWLGVAPSSAKRLARRITMVMTQNAAPRTSVFGCCAATLIAAIGMFVMPSLACPPDKESGTCNETTPAAAKAKKVKSGQEDVEFYGEAPALEAMRQRQPGATSGQAPVAPRAPKPPKAPKPPAPPRPAQAPLAGVAPAPAFGAGVDLEALKEGREPREYDLPEGKLHAFYGLMSRDDVPILVQLEDDHILIWGTESEHRVFADFVKIVGGGARLAAGMPLTAELYTRAVPGADLGRARALAVQELAAGEVRERVRAEADRARGEGERARAWASQLRELVPERNARAADAKSMEQRLIEFERQLEEIERRTHELERRRGASAQPSDER